jgi:hypothetical protein
MNRRRQLYSQLREAAKAEIAARIEDHRRNTARVRRGFKRRKSLGGKLLMLPLDFLAIGDSWFEYPLNGNDLPFPPFPIQNFAIAADSQLGSVGSPPPRILNLSEHGQATTAMLSYEKQEQMIGVLSDPSQWLNEQTHLPDAILVSAGGDDIAGDQFAVYLDYGGSGGLDLTRFQGVLDSVKASYFDLFAFRDIFANGVPIVGHCYDYAIPNGVHPVCVTQAWLQPSLQFAGYDYNEGIAIILQAIDLFYAMLQSFASDATLPPGKTTNNFILVDTRNTLARDPYFPNGWANEIHPYPVGFSSLAGRFLTRLQGKFPGRI